MPSARATEKMVPTVEGEWARKRRMMSYAWPIVVRGGLLDPRGYRPLYALMIGLAPAAALRLAAAARARRAGHARAARARPRVRGGRRRAGGACWRPRRPARACRSRPLLVARYYVLTTAALAAGLYDWLRHGTEVGWETPEGTR